MMTNSSSMQEPEDRTKLRTIIVTYDDESDKN